MDASTGAAPAHGRFADGRVPVSPRRINANDQVGSPSRNRTEVSRVRAGHSSIELRGSDWSGCRVPPTDLRLPRPGLFCTSFTQAATIGADDGQDLAVTAVTACAANARQGGADDG